MRLINLKYRLGQCTMVFTDGYSLKRQVIMVINIVCNLDG